MGVDRGRHLKARDQEDQGLKRRVTPKQVERIWCREGLKAPERQAKRRRRERNGGYCIRLEPKHRHPAWADDFTSDQTREGRS